MKLLTRQQRIVVVAAAAGALVAGVAVAWTVRHGLPSAQAAARAVYYCPMHPTYTSDRPGECPICHMKLVKRELEPSAASGAAAAHPKDICYLHNCPMEKQGQPCPMLVVAKAGEKVTCPICGTHIAGAAAPAQPRKILYWTDPMIPGYKSDKPGKSPMGMDLVPVYEEESPVASGEVPAGYAEVLISPQKQQLIGVKTSPVTMRRLTKTIRTVGTVAHDPELYQAQQEFIQAQQSLVRAQAGGMPEVVEPTKRLAEASRFRLRHLGLSEPMIDEIAAWEQPDPRLLVGGKPGEYWVYAQVYEYELPLVRAGQAADISLSALPGERFSGVVKAVDPLVDPATRSVRARILLNDPKGLLKPSMYVDVSIRVDLGEVLAIPDSAVFATGTQQIVFVDRGQGLLEPREVTLGAKADQFDEVKQGVNEGESVVTSGNFLIDSESRLKAALEGMATPEAGAHQHGQ